MCGGHRRRTPARRGRTGPEPDVRVPTVLSTLCTGRRGPSIQSGSRSVPRVSGLRPRPWPVGVSGNPRRPGILLPQLTPRQVHSLLSGTGRSYRIRVAHRLVRDCARGESGARADAGRRRGVDRVGAHVRTIARCFVVPIDACYELVGRLRTVWRGFDGGQDAARAVDEFFGRVEARSRSA